MSEAFWNDISESIVNGRWRTTKASDPNLDADRFIKGAKISDCEIIQIALLADIAKSLRALRCSNFVGVPHVLRDIRRNTTKPGKRKAKKK